MKASKSIIVGICFAVFFFEYSFAQAPLAFNYQAIVRDVSGSVRAEQPVNIQIAILQGSIAGSAVYVETHATTTNLTGLINLKIGEGNAISGSMTAINWTEGPYFIKIWVDGVEMGTSQLLTVPYAMYASEAGNGFSGDYNELTNKPILFSGNYNDLTNKPELFDGTWLSLEGKPDFDSLSFSGNYNDLINKPVKIGDFSGDMNNQKISNLSYPTADHDAVNKSYVTLKVSKTGDTLYLGKNQYVIIPGISEANPHTNTVIDIEGNEYNTVTIGTQVWMAENLKSTRFNDSTSIPLVMDTIAWINLTSPAYCYYENNEQLYKNSYGGLYNWYTVNTEKLCPSGWRIPSETDWNTLIDFLGGADIAGGKLKEAGTVHWESPNTGATNSSGFTGLPGSSRTYQGIFYNLGRGGVWWSSTENGYSTAWYRSVGYLVNYVGVSGSYKISGFSVRCLKD